MHLSQISVSTPLEDVPLAFVDVETTGLSPRFGHRVIEVAVLRVSGGRVTHSFERLINPGRALSDGITRLTGISALMLVDAPQFIEVMADICETMRGAVVVGHNTSFDAAFLRSELASCGRSLCDDLNDPVVLDTLRMARRLCRGQRNGLSALCARLDVKVEHAAHRAMGDCHRTFGAFQAMLQPHGGFRLSWRDLLELHGRPGSLRDRSAQRSSFAPPLPQFSSECAGMSPAAIIE